MAMAVVPPPTGDDRPFTPDSRHLDESPSVSVIVPAFNEERTIDALLRRLVAVANGRWQILIVNDGSTDATATVLEPWATVPGVRVAHHATNRGKGAAVRTGLSHATGEVVVIQDADLEYDPADLPRLLESFRDAQVQAVYGTRYGPHAQLPWTKFRLAVSLLNGLVLLLYGRRLHDEATCYKLLRRSLMASLELRSNRFELCAEITAKVCRLGIPVVERPISYHPRGYSDGKKIGVSAFVQCVKELVRWRFASLPVKPKSETSNGVPMMTNQNPCPVPIRFGTLAGFAGYLGLLVVCFLAVHQIAPQPATAGAMLTIADPSRLNLGQRWHGETVEWSIRLLNRSKSPLDVKAVRSLCDCIYAGQSSFVIPAEAVHDLQIKVRLAVEGAKNSEQFRRNIDIVLAGPPGHDRVISFPISAVVRHVATVEPTVVDLGDELVRGEPTQPFQVAVRTLIPVADVDAVGDASVDATVVREGATPIFRLKARATPRTAGSWTPRVSLRFLDGAGKLIGEIPVFVRATVLERVAVDPPEYFFGRVELGEERQVTATFKSRTGKPFSLLGSKTSGKEVSVAPLAEPNAMRISLRFPTAGDIDNSVSFTVKEPDGEPFPIVVRLMAHVVRQPQPAANTAQKQ